MRKNIKLIAALGLVLLSLSCAKERKIKRKHDFEGNRWFKSHFLQNVPYLYKVTIVKTSQRSAFGFVGVQSDMQAGYFEFTQNKLLFKKAVTLYAEDKSAGDIINSWDIKHTQYRLDEVDGRVTNNEVEDETIPWNQKNAFKVDWNKAAISETATFPFQIDKECWDKRSTEMVDGSQEVSDDRINFTLSVLYELKPECLSYERYHNQDLTHTVHYKYSFIPEEQNDYQPYLYSGENDPLMGKYGYFNTIVETLDDRGLPANKFLMNRFHPQRTHTFYFVPGFPDKYKWIFGDPNIGIMKKTNDLFAAHGLNIRFEVKDSDGSQKFGDVGTSFINFVEQVDAGAPFGYGPSDPNPMTGEIVSANLLVWTGYIEYYVQRVYDQIDRENTVTKNSSIYREMVRKLGDRSKWTDTATVLAPGSDSGHYFTFLLPQYTFGRSGNGFARRDPEDFFPLKKTEDILSMVRDGYRAELEKALEPALGSARRGLEQMAKHSHNHRDTVIYGLDDVLTDARSLLLDGLTPEETVEALLYRVSIHEFGHNLNLRHNFYGSVDKANFRPPVVVDGVEYEQHSSSVMDYQPLRDEIYFHYGWETYDEAALLYAYSDGNVDMSKTNNTTYLYCTDEQVTINALCNRHDNGTTPSEIMASLISSYEDAYWVRNFRNDRAYWSTYGYGASMFMTMWNIKKFFKLLEQTYETEDVVKKLAKVNSVTANDATVIAQNIQKDIKRAIKMGVAFYDAVLQQETSDRPFKSVYESWSGAMVQKGIGEDKFFALMFLVDGDGFPYDPNGSNSATASFFDLQDDPEIGSFVVETLTSNVKEPGPWFLGFDSLARYFYMSNASNWETLGNPKKFVETYRMACYRAETFKARFTFPAETKISGMFSGAFTSTTDNYFEGNPDIAVLENQGNYYVASVKKNPLAAEMIKTATSQNLMGKVQSNVAETYAMYNRLVQNRVPDCE